MENQEFAIFENVCRAGLSGPHSVPKSNLAPIMSDKVLEQVKVLWPHLAIGDSVCEKCKTRARHEERRRSGSRSPSPRSPRESMDLSFGSPEVAETMAKTISNQPARLFDSYNLTEITEGPWAGRSIEDVANELAELQPRLAETIKNAAPQ